MKRGDLIRHRKSGELGIVLRSSPNPKSDPESIYCYVDFLWLDDGLEDTAHSGLFEVISESK